MNARRASSAIADATVSLDCELYLPSLDVARLSWSGREFEGKPRLDPEIAIDLVTLETLPTEYGRVLYDAICPVDSRLRSGLKEAVAEARRTRRRLRLRLHLSSELPNWVHSLYWELLADREHRLAFGRSPETAFSRYGGMAQPLGEVIEGRPRLLVVISAPSNVENYQMARIDAERVKAQIAALAAQVADEIDIEFLDPPATLERLRHRLGSYQFLHIFGHGLIAKPSGPNNEPESALLLEDDQGLGRPVPEELLTELFLGDRELRLITLIACHGGAPSSGDRWSGLAGRLVERGTPAVVAMRRAVSLDDAHRFTQHLYLQLVKTRRIDLAVNEARQQLFLREPDGIDWSSPILHQRLVEGRLWVTAPDLTQSEATEALSRAFPRLPRFQISARRLRRPRAWVPVLAWMIFTGLRHWPAEETLVEIEAEVTRVAFRLAENSSLLGKIHLREIAASRLESLRTPMSAASGVNAITRQVGFRLTASDRPSRIELSAPTLVRGARVAFESQGDRLFRLSIAASTQELLATFSGPVAFKAFDKPEKTITPAKSDSIVLRPEQKSIEIDLAFESSDGKEFSRKIPIDRLEFQSISYRASPAASEIQRYSSILKGKIRVVATGEERLLGRDDVVVFENIRGFLVDLRILESTMSLQFHGKIERGAALQNAQGVRSLSVSLLDHWISNPKQERYNNYLLFFATVSVLISLVKQR